MLSFFRSSQKEVNNEADRLTPFADDDLKELLGKISGTSLTSKDSELLPSATGAGFIQKSAALDSVRHKIATESGRLSVTDLARSHDLQLTAVEYILEDSGSAFTSDRSHVLTRAEQQRIVLALKHEASLAFVDLEHFAISEMVERSLLVMLGGDSFERATLGDGRFYASPTLVASAREGIKHELKDAHDNKRVHAFAASDTLNLPAPVYLQLAKSVMSQASISGNVRLDGEAVLFVPKSFIDQAKVEQLSALQSGETPYMTLKEYSLAYSSESLIDDLARFDNYVVSRKYLAYTVSRTCRRALEAGHASVREALSELPDKIETLVVRDVLAHQLSSTDDGIFVIADQIFSSTWLETQRDLVLKDIVTLAQASWDDENFVKLKGSILKSRLQERAEKTLGLDPHLFDLIWTDSSRGILFSALDEFSDTMARLNETCEKEFQHFWISRVASKYILHASGVDSISDDSLRLQLADLLRTHLASDLVPAAAARAKAKGLTKSASLKQGARMTKLLNQLGESKDLASSIELLRSFEARVFVGEAATIDKSNAKHSLLQDMLKTIRKDQDAPRLYLTLIVVVVASRQDGVVYATGKFAPKLLKHIRASIEPELAERLEQWKESVKTGKVTDTDRDAMRRVVTDILQQYNST